MGNVLAGIGLSADLETIKIPSPQSHSVKQWRFGKRRLILTDDLGEAVTPGRNHFFTNLHAIQRDGDGALKSVYDLGSGTVTNVGVLSMANDFAWANPSGVATSTLGLQNFHAVGTGTNAATVNDIKLQTLAAPTTTTAVTGAQSLISAASVQIYQTVATVNFTGSAAITEWGLHNNATLSATTGTPFTAGTATTGTVTGTPYTASSSTLMGEQQMVFQDTSAATPFWGLCTSNTTSVVTVPAWYTVANGSVSGSNPANSDALVILPVLWDRRTFAAINVVSGDSIQFTYKLQVVAGG